MSQSYEQIFILKVSLPEFIGAFLFFIDFLFNLLYYDNTFVEENY